MIQHFLSMFGLLLEEKEKELSSSFWVFNSQIKIRWIPNKDKHSSVYSLYTGLHTTLICKVELLVNSKAGATHIVGFLSNIHSLRLSDFTRHTCATVSLGESVTDSIHLLAHEDFFYGWNHCYEFVVCCNLSILGHDFRYHLIIEMSLGPLFTQVLPLWSKVCRSIFQVSQTKKNISILFSSSLLIKTPGKWNCLLTMYWTLTGQHSFHRQYKSTFKALLQYFI